MLCGACLNQLGFKETYLPCRQKYYKERDIEGDEKILHEKGRRGLDLFFLFLQVSFIQIVFGHIDEFLYHASP